MRHPNFPSKKLPTNSARLFSTPEFFQFASMKAKELQADKSLKLPA
jgi:hypothetical protein